MSFSAPPGRITAVLGPNGAGKTTTVECCEGLRRADGGTVRVLGADPWRASARDRARVGVMLQDGGLAMAARTRELLDHVARLHADPHDPGWLVDLLGLTGQARTTVRRLSGGQRQRLALALAVVGRPELVFLDEPTSGLDPQARLAAWELVGRLRADGVSVVLTTHAMDEAEQLADRVVVLDAGRVVTSGSPAELTGSGETLRFRTRPGLDLSSLTTALRDAGHPPTRVGETTPGNYLVEPTPGRPADPTLLAVVATWCSRLGVHPENLTLRRRSLEDVYLDLTGRTWR
jgi:ABC-2 type transport system ATP-binding protein